MGSTREMLSRLGSTAGCMRRYAAGTVLGSAALAVTSAVAGAAGSTMLHLECNGEAALIGAVGGATLGAAIGLASFAYDDFIRYAYQETGTAGVWFASLSFLSQFTMLPMYAGEAILSYLDADLGVPHYQMLRAFLHGTFTPATILTCIASSLIVAATSMVKGICEIDEEEVRKCRC